MQSAANFSADDIEQIAIETFAEAACDPSLGVNSHARSYGWDPINDYGEFRQSRERAVTFRLLDHLVSTQQEGLRDREAEHLCSL